MNQYVGHLISDIHTARFQQISLGSTIRIHGHLLREIGKETTHVDVLFKMRLPVVTGIDPVNLMAIRSSERDHFDRFQMSLRRSVNEMIRESPSDDAERIARRIVRDVVEPELVKIGDTLKAASWVLEKRVKLGLTLGVLATTVGWIGGMTDQMAMGAGVAAAAATMGTGFGKLAEVQGDASLNDMYFLWKAQGHAKMPRRTAATRRR